MLTFYTDNGMVDEGLIDYIFPRFWFNEVSFVMKYKLCAGWIILKHERPKADTMYFAFLCNSNKIERS